MASKEGLSCCAVVSGRLLRSASLGFPSFVPIYDSRNAVRNHLRFILGYRNGGHIYVNVWQIWGPICLSMRVDLDEKRMTPTLTSDPSVQCCGIFPLGGTHNVGGKNEDRCIHCWGTWVNTCFSKADQ